MGSCPNCGRLLDEWAEQTDSGHWFCGGCGWDLRGQDSELDEEASMPDVTFDEDDTPVLAYLLEQMGLF